MQVNRLKRKKTNRNLLTKNGENAGANVIIAQDETSDLIDVAHTIQHINLQEHILLSELCKLNKISLDLAEKNSND